MSEEESKLPNWSSVEEVYLLAERNFKKDKFTVEDIALARIGHDASRSALQAESTSLYNILRSASMYGLVEWLGGNEFRVAVLPEESDDLWTTTFSTRIVKLRELITKKMEEKPPLLRELEMLELDGKKYVIAYIGSETTSAGIDSFVYSVWNPEEQEGILLQAWGRNIKWRKILVMNLLAARMKRLYSDTQRLMRRHTEAIQGWLATYT